MPKNRSILGIDLRVTSVKVVEVLFGEGKPKLQSYGLAEIPYALRDLHPQKEDAQAHAIKEIIKDKNLKAKSAVVVLGGSDVFIRVVDLSAISGKDEINEAIKWKFAEEIPFSIEDALFDYYPVGEGAEQGIQRYLAACIHKNTYKNLESVMIKAGLNLSSVVIMPDAIFQVFKNKIPQEDGQNIALVYMGKRTTDISIFKKNSLVFHRSLNIGGENITQAMAGVMISEKGMVEISSEEAETLKVEHGIPIGDAEYPSVSDIPVSQLKARVRPALEKVQSEISRTLEYYKGQSGDAEVKEIILSGGSSITPNLLTFLSEGLNVPVVSADAMFEFDAAAKVGKEVPRLSVALGATLIPEGKINLLPDEIKHRFEKMLKKYLQPQYLAPVLLVFLFLIYAMFWVQGLLLNNALTVMKTKLEKYKPQIETLKMIQESAMSSHEKRVALLAQKEKRMRLPLIFEEISRITKRNIILNRATLTGPNISFWGIAFEDATSAENNLSRFVLDLSASSFFSEVRLIHAAKSNNYVTNAFNFEITANLKEKVK